MNANEPGHNMPTPKGVEAEETETLRLRVSKDMMRVLVDCSLDGKDFEEIAGVIVSKLRSFGIAKPPTHNVVVQWLCDQARMGGVLEGAVLVEGVPLVPPVDGVIDWAGDFFNQGFVLDESSDRVDFRNHAGQRNVKREQLLATIVAPQKGKNGRDVRGQIIRARKPKLPKIRLGCNVRVDEGSSTYYSEIDGRIRWHRNFLSVDERFEIEGDVGLDTGNISHSGSVIVHRDVLEGARLEAIGDIEVFGVVESAHVQTGGSLVVHGGITGAVGSHIIAAGGVSALYIIDANVQAGEDVVVDREIVQSTVQTRGAIYMPRGRVVGGQLVALGGIDVGQVGSAASVPTEVIAGEDYCLEGQLLSVRTRTKRTAANVEKIHATLEPLRGKVSALSDEKKAVVTKLLEQVNMMEASLRALAGEEDELRRETQERENHTVLIRNTLFSDSRIGAHGEMFVAKETHKGPVSPVKSPDGLRMQVTRRKSIEKVTGEEAQGTTT